jgi:hypothetical protein
VLRAFAQGLEAEELKRTGFFHLLTIRLLQAASASAAEISLVRVISMPGQVLGGIALAVPPFLFRSTPGIATARQSA